MLANLFIAILVISMGAFLLYYVACRDKGVGYLLFGELFILVGVLCLIKVTTLVSNGCVLENFSHLAPVSDNVYLIQDQGTYVYKVTYEYKENTSSSSNIRTIQLCPNTQLKVNYIDKGQPFMRELRKTGWIKTQIEYTFYLPSENWHYN